MTMTLSPQSTCGVNDGLCLPRSRIATIEASRPTTSPSASIMTHFLSTSAGFAEKVFIFASIMEKRSCTGVLAGYLSPVPHVVNTDKVGIAKYFKDLSQRYY